MSRKQTSTYDVELFFEYGLDLPSRTIYLGEADYDGDGSGTGVDFKMAERFIKALYILDKKAPQGDQPITVIANNPGGSWYDGMAIYGAIKEAENWVVMKMYGYAMSMGSIIPQAADERVIDPYCRFMTHYGEDYSNNHSKIVARHGDEGKRVNKMMEDIYLDRIMEKDEKEAKTGNVWYIDQVFSEIVNRRDELDYPKPKAVKYNFSRNPTKRREDVRTALKELLNFDTFLTAEETVALGLACRVGGK
jgi:ATP-dependent protease ClpP protease subunit